MCVWGEEQCHRKLNGGKTDSVRKKGTLATFDNTGRHSPSPCCSLQAAASFTGASHNSQDVEEDVDDVSVKVEGCKNVLLWTQGQLLVAQEKLSVDSQKLQTTNTKDFRQFKKGFTVHRVQITVVYKRCATYNTD